MPKKRIDKPLPEHLKPIPIDGPTSWKKGEPVERISSYLSGVEGAQKKRLKLWIDVFEKGFAKTGNPLFIWDAFLLSRKIGGSIPEWILQYLDDAARGLLVAENAIGDVATILKFKRGKRGGANVFTQYLNFHAQETAANAALLALHENPSLKVGGKDTDKGSTAVDIAHDELLKRWNISLNTGTIKNYFNKKYPTKGTKTP